MSSLVSQGGLGCCHHQNILLDKAQTPPDELLTYHLKFRFYYQPYQAASPASHANLLRMYYQTEAQAGEYDIPKCPQVRNTLREGLKKKHGKLSTFCG